MSEGAATIIQRRGRLSARISRRPLAFALTDIPAPAEGQIACVCVCAAAVHASGQPGGIRAFMKPFKTYELDLDALARFDRPVYFALVGLSNPTSMRRSQPGSAGSSKTSSSRNSRSDITSTRGIGSNPSGSQAH